MPERRLGLSSAVRDYFPRLLERVNGRERAAEPEVPGRRGAEDRRREVAAVRRAGDGCSGFVELVYHEAGDSLPRGSVDQYAATKPLKPSQVLPGDLIFFAMAHPAAKRVDRVGICLGKELFIAASATYGIHIESIAKPCCRERLVSIRKFSGF